VRRRLRAREIGVRKMKIRTRESGSKWDLDGKLGGSGAIQANRTEFDNNWAASRLSSGTLPDLASPLP